MRPPAAALAAVAVAAALVPSATAARGAVLVELFTSQGCSSCPPADRLLTRLGSEPGLAGEVVPLAFHVDYWNWIGWRDPFSAAGWSRRQRTYASAFRSDRIYTPQAVVGGRRDCNGGDLRCIRGAVEEIAAQAGGEVALALEPAGGGAVRVTVTARPPAAAGPLDVMLAVFEKGLETPVGRGENARKTLRNDYVVRRLERPFVLGGPARRRGTTTVELDPSWKRADLGIAVFLQDPKSRRIFAATAAAAPAR